MTNKGQHQEPEAFTTGTAGNGSRPPSGEEEQDTRNRAKRAAAHTATGPRTPQGKKRSRLNAIKHGLFSKAVLLEGDSQTEYDSLLSEVHDYFQPVGIMESVEVENIAAILWRKRRFFLAEKAEISQNIKFSGIDAMGKRYVEAWERSRAAIASGGLLMPCDNPVVVREAIEALGMLRLIVTTNGFTEDSRLLKKLYGEDQDGAVPSGPRFVYELHAKCIKLAEKQGKQTNEPERRENMVTIIDNQLESLTNLEKMLITDDQERMLYKMSAAVIPGPEVLDRLLRQETHLDRQLDRALNRLERLQRRRKGRPMPPQLDVKFL